MKRLWIIGAGGFGREVYDWAVDVRRHHPRWDIAGFLDDNPEALAGRPCDLPLVGPVENHTFTGDDLAVIAIADPRTRMDISQRLEGRVHWETLIHPSAIIGSHTPIGEGTVICPRVVITTNSKVCEHVHINAFSSVGHDSLIGSFCTLSGHVDICGNVTLDQGVFFGSHATVIPRARVGEFARVGAGSMVLRAVRPNTTVIGVPARTIAALK